MLRRKLADSRASRHARGAARRGAGQLAGASDQNDRLVNTLRRPASRSSRSRRRSTGSPSRRPATASSSRRTRTARSTCSPAAASCGSRSAPTSSAHDLRRGQEVMLNEAMNVVRAMEFERAGEVVLLKELLEGGDRALVIGHTDDERVVQLADRCSAPPLRAGDSLLVETRSGYAYERIPKSEVEELVLEEVPGHRLRPDRRPRRPDRAHPRRRRAAVPAPGPVRRAPAASRRRACCSTARPDAARRSSPRRSPTRWRRRSPRSPARPEGKSFFLNIKGPELLNKYVGETERHIRLVFQRAREKAGEGTPVIVFFDEMDSLFRTRGSGVSSDVENTIVPQLLSEIDGVEGLENVIVIGASNREDMIDPAILRPGRLDVKIKIERPDAEAARDIFSKYLTTDLPLHPDDLAENGGDRRGDRRGDDPARRRADVRRERGEPLPRGHLRQRRQGGPVLQGLQLRRHDREHRRPGQEDGHQGLPRPRARRASALQHLLDACVDEFKENEDLPNTTNPDDWARISGKKGERIVYIRTLVTGKQGAEAGPVHRHGRQHRSVPVAAPAGRTSEVRRSRRRPRPCSRGHGLG